MRQERMTKREKRTAALLQRYANHEDEFAMLKGVLCLTHSMDFIDGNKVRALIDTQAIARRMDALIFEDFAETAKVRKCS